MENPTSLNNFENLIRVNSSKILNNHEQNQKLASLRNWLLPMLMNGQVSVSQAEEMVEEGLSMAAEEEVIYGEE